MSSIVNNLDDIKYNTLPKQPQKQPVKSSKKTTEPTPSQETGSSKQQPPSTSSAPKPQTTLSDTPPAHNPLEEPNIWCEILKLEGHHHENKVAEGFQTWLKKTIDSSLFEVQTNMYLFLIIYILTS